MKNPRLYSFLLNILNYFFKREKIEKDFDNKKVNFNIVVYYMEKESEKAKQKGFLNLSEEFNFAIQKLTKG